MSGTPLRLVAVLGVGLMACSLLTSTDGLVGAFADAAAPQDASGDDALTADGESDGSSGADGTTSTADGSPLDGSTVTPQCTQDDDCDGGACVADRCAQKPVTITTTGSGISALAVIGANVYYANVSEIVRKPLDGGLSSVVDDTGAQGDMAFDQSELYFPRNESIYRLPLDGGAASTVHAGSDSPITAVTVVGSELFFALQNQIFAIPKTGGTPVPRASGFTGLFGLSAAGTTLYATDSVEGKVFSVPATGGNATLIRSVPDVRSVYAEPPTLWLTTRTTGTVLAVRTDGTTLDVLADDLVLPTQITATPSALFWAANRSVMMLPR